MNLDSRFYRFRGGPSVNALFPVCSRIKRVDNEYDRDPIHCPSYGPGVLLTSKQTDSECGRDPLITSH